MLRSVDGIRGYTIAARDGKLGACKDVLFDDRTWALRFLVADTARWLPGRKVVISPVFLQAPRWEDRRFPVDLTVEQVKASPDLQEHQPVSRQYEKEYFDYYRFPYDWAGNQTWGSHPTPQMLGANREREPLTHPKASIEPEDRTLRSFSEVQGYHLVAGPEDVGMLKDLILEDGTWRIRYLAVGIGKLLAGTEQVMIPPDWVDTIEETERRIVLNVAPEAVREAPEYDPAVPINRVDEERLYDFYGRPVE